MESMKVAKGTRGTIIGEGKLEQLDASWGSGKTYKASSYIMTVQYLIFEKSYSTPPFQQGHM